MYRRTTVSAMRFNSHEDAGLYVRKIVNELVDVSMGYISQVDKDQQWLIYGRVVNSLFHRYYAPTIYHTHKSDNDIKDKLNEQFKKSPSKNKTKRFRTKK